MSREYKNRLIYSYKGIKFIVSEARVLHIKYQKEKPSCAKTKKTEQ